MAKDMIMAASPAILVMRRLFDRMNEIASNENESDSARANAATRALALLSNERELSALSNFGATLEDFTALVTSQVERATKAIEEVADPDQRDYLYRNLIELILKLTPYDSPFYLREQADAIYERIIGDDESELAYYDIMYNQARRVYFFPEEEDNIPSDEELEEKLESVGFAELISVESEVASFFAENLKSKDVSAKPFDELVFTYGLFIHSEEAFYLFSDVAPTRYLFSADVSKVGASRVRKFVESTYHATNSRLRTLDQGLKSILNDKSASSDDIETAQEMFEVARMQTVKSPAALTDGEFLRYFIEKYNSLDMLDGICQQLSAAMNWALDDLSSPSRLALYPKGADFYKGELYRYFKLANRLYRAFAEKADEPKEKALRLVRLARIEFLYDPAADAEKKGKNAIREALEAVAQCDAPNERVQVYRRMIEVHIEADMLKPASNLLDRMTGELDKIDSDLTRDFVKDEAFALYLQLCDKDKIDALLETIESKPRLTILRAKALANEGFNKFELAEKESADDAESVNVQALAQDLLSVVEKIIDEEHGAESEIAVEAFCELATFLTSRSKELVENAVDEREQNAI